MTDASDGKRDFFISFNQADRAWATWIAWTLKEAGYSVWFQDWDFKGSIAAAMEQGHRASTHTLAVLSDSYLASSYCRAEWEMRFHEDVDGTRGLIVPIRVAPCEPGALLGNLAWRDLFGLDEDAARVALLARTRQAIDTKYRPGADERPHFPGATGPFTPATRPPFPAPAAGPELATHNLPPFNPDFVGREQVLAELRRLLTSAPGPAVLTQTRAITGLGGIGKTQTALAYCYRRLADYTLVWWLHAETAATLAADFTTLAAPLSLDPAAADQEKLIASIRAALQASAGWLLVFDNVEEPGLPRTFLPSTGRGHALITSRRTDWQGLARALPLEVMQEGEALQLLTGRPDPEVLPADELAAAKALASELGHLPLALAQARAYMAETGRSVAGYRRLLQASRPAVLAKGRASPDYPASVAKAWQISIEAAEGACAAARPLLELFAFFSADPLPRAVLGAEPEALPEELRGELERDDAIAALHRFSLIRAEAGNIAVHRLVQAVTRDGLDEARAQACAAAAVQLVNTALPNPQEHTHWPAFGALLPHALTTAEAAERLEASLEAAAKVFNQTAVYHYSRAAYAEAEPLYQRALPLYQRALAIFEKVLGLEDPAVARSLHDLGELYHAQGRHAEAEPLLKRSLAIREKVLGPKHPDVAWSLKSLAELYHAQGRYAEAEPLLKRALTLFEETLRPEHPDVAWSLHDLAALYHAQGRYAEAEPLLKRALTIRETVFGPEHPAVASGLHALATLYHALGRHVEAEPLLKRSLAIREKALGPEHPDVAWSLQDLGRLYHAQGRSAEAEPLLKRALNLFEKMGHPAVARSLQDLGEFYHAQGRHVEAEPLLKRSLTIREKALRPEHPDVAWSLHALAVLYHDQGRHAEAKPLLKRSLAIREKGLGPEHPDVAWSLHALAVLYHDQGRHAEAKPLLKRLLAIREKALGPEHPDVALSLANLANLYQAGGRYAEAEPLYRRVLAIFRKTLPPDHPNIANALGHYTHLLDQLGRHDEAAALRAQTQAIRSGSPTGRQHGPGLET